MKVHAKDIKVGDIISEQGVISERWDPMFPDEGKEKSEFVRYIILEKIMEADDGGCSTNYTSFYFKTMIIYALPQIIDLWRDMHESPANSGIYLLSDYEIDEEDYDEDYAYDMYGEPRTPREWYKL